jgi:hypothetical protein
VQLLRVQNCTCAIGFISLCKSKSSTESKSWATSLSLQVKKFDRVDVGQHHSHNPIYCFHPTVMIVNQDTDLLHALQSTRDAGGALETLHQLTMLQQWSGGTRKQRLDHSRMSWHNHAKQLLHEDRFVNEYTMSHGAHRELTEILRPYLQRKEFNSRSAEPIAVEHMVAAGLRTLQGGRVKDARHIVKSSRSAAYAMVDDFIDAVNSAPELDITFPQHVDEWRAVNEGFRRRSDNDTMGGAVTAIDGFFQRCNRPTVKETNNVVSYYSGHYESYGVNCLAAVKADLQFMYFGVISPGSTNDITSYSLAASLRTIIDTLPAGLYAVGDAAFPLGEKLLIPFVGTHRHSNPYHDSFNYYLSQLRIRVEMAFGRLVNKFRILNGKVNGSLARVSAVLNACARLHNFIIQRDGPSDDATVGMSIGEEENHLQIRPNNASPLGMSYLPTIPDDNYVFETEEGDSQTRAEIVEFLTDNLMRRPLHNVLRRRRELATAAQNRELNDGWVFSQNGNGDVFAVATEFISP